MQPNIFTLLYLYVIAFGGMICAVIGFQLFGLPGGAIGALVGAASSQILGCWASSAMNRLTERHYRRMSTSMLRTRLDEGVTAASYISCLIISILLERGDSVDGFRKYIFRQLHSGSTCERRAGLANLWLCNSILAAKLVGFNVFGPTTADLERLNGIEMEWSEQPQRDLPPLQT
ncbi:MAG: hypothetical protein NTY15_06645 [Planctomycetota bacterium]|nr:hypothetical protein [Planctomycetota bacterium]